MARIPAAATAIVRTGPFLGINECTSGDAVVKEGQAADMQNFQITADGALQVRPGTRPLWRFDAPVEGFWSGHVGGQSVQVAAAGHQLWLLGKAGDATAAGSIGPGRAVFFGFDQKLYILTPSRYLEWNGHGLATDVAGYRPVVAVGVPPGGGGALLEGVNLLTGAKRIHTSPDGTARRFLLPETGLASVDYVIHRATGAHLAHSADLATGEVTLTAVPPAGVNTLEIGWTCGSGQRSRVTGMGFYELFSGATDNLVFLYGDHSNQAIYCGVDYEGHPNATYFPALNLLTAGSANTPITGLIRHFSQLLVFKTDGAWRAVAGNLTLENGLTTPAFYVTPLNRAVGHCAMGQVALADNNPRTLHAGGLYQWVSQGTLASDERSARKLSDRVAASLGGMDLTCALCFDDEARGDYYICQGGQAVVHNYQLDVFTRYTQFPVRSIGVLDGALFVGREDGTLCHVSRDYRNDDGKPIDAYWRSGARSFGRPWQKKHLTTLWVGLKPESGAKLTVSARSDHSVALSTSTLHASLASYANVNYGDWSFSTSRQSRVRRLRRRVSQAAYEQLVLQSSSASATATVLWLEEEVVFGRRA